MGSFHAVTWDDNTRRGAVTIVVIHMRLRTSILLDVRFPVSAIRAMRACASVKGGRDEAVVPFILINSVTADPCCHLHHHRHRCTIMELVNQLMPLTNWQ